MTSARGYGSRRSPGRRGYMVTVRKEISRSGPLLLRVGKEQLLAIDLIAGDRRLAFRRDEPIDERLPEFPLHGRIFFGIHQHDAILIEQPFVALDEDFEIAAVLEGNPGAAVRQHVTTHRRRGIE